MKSINRGYLLVLIAFFIIILILFVFLFYCNRCKKQSSVPQQGGNISWNILFKEGTTKDTREKVIKNIKQYVQDFYDDYNAINGTSFTPQDHVATCPCDTLLYNYDFLSIFGAGPSVTTAQSSQTTEANGNALISNNIPITEPQKPVTRKTDNQYVIDSIPLFNKRIDTSKILAIIDSGIDPGLFTPSLDGLIWKDVVPASTIYNFLPFQVQTNVMDATDGKHGSAVASVTMKTMENNAVYPRLMILKALNEKNQGSVFSVSCALSYAIQKKATIINLSLGYEGSEDSILHHYIGRCASVTPAIELFVAAGNMPAPHISSNFCLPNTSNQLNSARLFYPACFSKDYDNVTSVTQMSNPKTGCYYQNYSNEYIKLGVLDTSNCCAIKVDFQRISNYYEGSSFATPVASGLRMGTLLQPSNWNSLIRIDPLKKVSIDGKYIMYSSNP
ncbi:MAG: S8/S53 family peptidase [Ferruginibacter sp.]|nr:S8/S53 family peptidase [Ferruginibacter sp.]